MSINTVLKVIRHAASQVTENELPKRVAEVDEMGSFVEKKAHPSWLWYVFEAHSKKIPVWVVGGTTDETCQRLFGKLQGCQITRFCTDA